VARKSPEVLRFARGMGVATGRGMSEARLSDHAIMLFLAGVAIALGVVGAAGCGGDDESGIDAPVAHDASGDLDGAATDGPSSDAPASDGAPTDDAQRADASENGDSGVGSFCGGFVPTECPGDALYCDYDFGDCGNGDGGGTCQPRPLACDDNIDYVCACNGQVYTNECEAHADGQDLNEYGGCEAPEDTFGCGAHYCNLGFDYCLRIVSDVLGIPDDWSCEPLPGSCGDPADCACLEDEPCGDFCTDEGEGALRLTCPGG
jgi:hypothetical protein